MRVLLADVQSRVRFALRVLLERLPDLQVIGEADDAESLLAQTQATLPDLLLLGWPLPDGALGHLLSTVRQICPQLPVIALSGRPEARRAAMRAGANAFVYKGDPPEELLAAIVDCWYTRQGESLPVAPSATAPKPQLGQFI